MRLPGLLSAEVARMVERLIDTQRGMGSSPILGTNRCTVLEAAQRLAQYRTWRLQLSTIRDDGYSRRVLVLDQFESEADQSDGVAEHGDALAVALGPAVQPVQLVP